MLLLGALFALFGAGFWLCCLTDVALTPRRECRALPKTAWIVLVAATFVAGAVVWLAFRRRGLPIRPRRRAATRMTCRHRRRNAAIPRSAAPAHVRRPGIARACPGRTTWAG